MIFFIIYHQFKISQLLESMSDISRKVKKYFDLENSEEQR